MKLPIDVVGNRPLKFKWKHTVSTLNGTVTQECEGSLPLTIDIAVAEVIALAKQQQQEIIGLRKQIEGYAERIAAQSELLSKKAEPIPQEQRRKGK